MLAVEPKESLTRGSGVSVGVTVPAEDMTSAGFAVGVLLHPPPSFARTNTGSNRSSSSSRKVSDKSSNADDLAAKGADAENDNEQGPSRVNDSCRQSNKPRDENDDEELATSRTMQALEIEEETKLPSLKMSKSDDTEDSHFSENDALDDMEGLLDNHQALASSTENKRKKSKSHKQKLFVRSRAFCCASQKIGNTTVFWPSMYHKTGWGMIGPHVWGPPCVMALLWSASWYFIRHALYSIGVLSAAVCTLFTVLATYFFMDAAFRDPGIVTPGLAAVATNGMRPPPPDRNHRWCDLCQAYQPPTGAHCPECNVCVTGYDHHCAWMGCCIGHKNYKSFLKFNMTWLVYLSYAVIWVSLLGPVLFQSKHDNKGTKGSEQSAFEDLFVDNDGEGPLFR